jgi:hypothetical protein
MKGLNPRPTQAAQTLPKEPFDLPFEKQNREEESMPLFPKWNPHIAPLCPNSLLQNTFDLSPYFQRPSQKIAPNLMILIDYRSTIHQPVNSFQSWNLCPSPSTPVPRTEGSGTESCPSY